MICARGANRSEGPIMRKTRLFTVAALIVLAGLGSAWAQIGVTDPATTARNRVIAAAKQRLVDLVTAQRDRLEQMARRLGAEHLSTYRTPNAPGWRKANGQDLLYAREYYAALSTGDVTGGAYERVTRSRAPAADIVSGLTPSARAALESALSTLDLADSGLVTGSHQVGVLRANGLAETRALDALEADVLDPSGDQSTAALLGKVSGAVLVETRQKQARLQLLTGIVEQLLVENKRARDTEAAVLNMRLRQLYGIGDDEGGGFLTGAAEDLRTWRQP